MKSIFKISILIIIAGISFLLHSCANRGQGPTGGAKDETPPKVVKSSPVNGALNYKKKEINIYFDENISIEKANDNVLISPPQLKQPEVKGNARVVTVRFEEALLDSTTYTINFGNAIVDLNEKNPLQNYRFSFSTGDVIDTLQIAGKIINAEDLNPLSGIIVGIHNVGDDENFFKKPFLRIARTDENGKFTIDNVKEGVYNIFALGDSNKDYFYQAGEGLAFTDSVFSPTVQTVIKNDTLWHDSLTIDTIKTVRQIDYAPQNVLMRYFKEDKKRQYLVKTERLVEHQFKIFFNAPQTELPEIQAINTEWDNKHILQHSTNKDTLTLWLTDSMLIKKDTIELQVKYLKTDSAFNLVSQTDTISAFVRKMGVTTRGQKNQSATQPKDFKFSTNASGSFDIYLPVLFKFDAPLSSYDLSKIHLSEKVDTILKPVDYEWLPYDSTKMTYALKHPWGAEKNYELQIDSAAFTSIYQLISDKLKNSMKIKSLDEYAALKISTATFDPKVVFQLLGTKDNVLQTLPAKEGGVIFEYLKPGDYYMRAFVDENENGQWTTGNIEKRIQPEEVFYYPKKLTLRANWEFEETWNLYDVPLQSQKPTELIKDGSKTNK